MSSSIRSQKDCFIFKHRSFAMKNLVWETNCIEGLHPLKLCVSKSQVSAVKKYSESHLSVSERHIKPGHISSDRYLHSSKMFEDVPLFPKFALDSLVCELCLSAKMKKSTIQLDRHDEQEPFSEVHFDISGSVSPSLGRNTYPAHIMEPTTAKSDFSLISKKHELTNAIKHYIAMVENN